MRRAAFLLAFCLSQLALHAQLPVTADGVRQPRILILLDGSSSMLSPWGANLQRFTAAAKVVMTLMDSIYAINNSVEFGLRVYGHTTPAQENNCTDTRREVMFSKNNATQMSLRLAALHPLGVSPIAYSLKEAADNDLEDETRNAYSIILITDGGESCGGDICGVMASLVQRKIFFKPYIIGLVDYAPLKDQYACLGTYLQATKESDIPIAIKKIAEDYRPMLRMPIMVASKPVIQPKNNPDVRVITVPAQPSLPKESELSSLSPVVRVAPFPAYYYMPLPHVVALPQLPKMRVEAAPVVAVVPPPQKPVVEKPVVAITKPVVAPPVKDTAKTTVTIKPLPPAKTKPVATKPVKEDTRPKEAPAVTSVENAKETTAAIYFTDGHGRFYHTSPSIQLFDAGTGKLAKEFYRTVGPGGDPDLQPLPPGTYNLMIAGRSTYITHNVVIEAGKTNKIVIPVSNGSIKFVYDGAEDRPIEEFEAIVKIRFEEGAPIKQHCTAEIPYPPGNYYIEVNTLPITRYNADVDFGSTTELSLPQPGYMQITNRNAIGDVYFYYPLGDKYVHFHDLAITGRPDDQKLRLKPGAYEVHWKKTPNMPYAQETIQKFLVKPNAVTEVELH